MRKTLQDLAFYLKEIIVPETDDLYAASPLFDGISTEEDARTGVAAFRAFLCRLYDVLLAKGDAFDNHKKVAHAYENRTSISVYYPFMHYVKTILMNMGIHGALAEDALSLASGSDLFNEKISVSKNLACLRFLADCGLCIDGIDLSQKKQNLSDIGTIRISYPDNPAMLTGLKVMAVAETKLGTLDNQDILLRCDDRVLRRDKPDALSILKDTIRPLPEDVQRFILRLHQRYVDQGVTCAVEIKGFYIYTKYSYKRKDLWGFNTSLHNGYEINVKAANTDKYADTIKTFPQALQAVIGKGYGCGRKRAEVGHCDGGCLGLRIPLDSTILAMRDDIDTWFDNELMCLQKK